MAEAFHAANNYLVFRLQLHSVAHDGLPIFYEAADEIKRLQEERKKIIAERDEARRLVCRHTKKTYRTLRETAEERGWDCFKEQP